MILGFFSLRHKRMVWGKRVSTNHPRAWGVGAHVARHALWRWSQGVVMLEYNGHAGPSSRQLPSKYLLPTHVGRVPGLYTSRGGTVLSIELKSIQWSPWHTTPAEQARCLALPKVYGSKFPDGRIRPLKCPRSLRQTLHRRSLVCHHDKRPGRGAPMGRVADEVDVLTTARYRPPDPTTRI